ncbi:hypothetical protein AAE478_009911 [Parahypoxylon ruwenzoriense]
MAYQASAYSSPRREAAIKRDNTAAILLSLTKNQRISITMADPLSIAASVAGIVAFAASTARTLISLTQEMADAPNEILYIRRDVQSLAVVLGSIKDVCTKYGLRSEDLALGGSLTENVSQCQDSMQSIRVLIEPLAVKGRGRRSPMKMVRWVMRKGEVRALRERLRENKASLNITISTLNGFCVLCSTPRKAKALIHDIAYLREKAKTKLGKMSSKFMRSLSSSFVVEETGRENKERVVSLIVGGCSTAERTQDGQTVLHFCAIYNDTEIAQVLLDHGADINARDNQLRSPLNVALSSEAMSVACLLLQRGCSLTGSIDLIFPLTQRTEEIPGIKTLLECLAGKFNKLGAGPYLVHQAIKSCDMESLALLLSAGFDPNMKNKHGELS